MLSSAIHRLGRNNISCLRTISSLKYSNIAPLQPRIHSHTTHIFPRINSPIIDIRKRFMSSSDMSSASIEKKDFSAPMADGYDPEAVEKQWDAFWEGNDLYKPHGGDGEKFVMVLPPPNVTGTLHLGHALTAAIEDSVTRWHRMNGHDTLWIPGIDHAGIATQVVVEKKLQRTEGVSRHDLGREEFIKRVWEWKEEHGERIFHQMRKLGTSVDWSRSRFTMDDVCAKAVLEAFVRMYENKQIYRENRIVTWSCALRSAVSSIEVDHIDVEGSTMVNVPGHPRPVEIGVIHSFAYKVKENPEEEIVVATTRIETMLGDVAVAVHPEDTRYQHLIGKKLIHPFIADREVVVVADDVLVDMSFGTGAVKITPAHDPNDFLCGKRHNLPRINILDDAGMINSNGGDKYVGMGRFEVREKIVGDLEALGLYRGKANNKMAVGVCSRSGDIIEPIVRPQWWVDCQEMAKRSIEAVQKKDLTILPQGAEQTWYRWLENIQDWCISRQLWWGHRIPAYYATLPGETYPTFEEDPSRWFIARDYNTALELAKAKLGSDVILHQDEDVLDTWFSSGLFPFSTLGWPEETPDLAKYFPGKLLETGSDILFFWVARMVMMSLALMDKLPFDTVYLHTLVRDRVGRKMSKSLGNVIDPIDVITGTSLEELHKRLETGNLPVKEVEIAKKNQEADFPKGIPQCGADALRFGLLGYTKQGNDINLDVNRLYIARTFCNKMWQATRFALMSFPADFVAPNSIEEMQASIEAAGGSTVAQRWILSRLHTAAEITENAFANYEFGLSTAALQTFFVDELCSKYLEVIKPIVRITEESSEQDKKVANSHLAVLFICLEYFLRLLHPMMPFVTEELYHRLPGHAERTQAAYERTQDKRILTGSIMVMPYPRPAITKVLYDDQAESQMNLIDSIVSTIRASKAGVGMTNKQRPDIYVLCNDTKVNTLVAQESSVIKVLSFVGNVVPVTHAEANQIPDGCISAVVNADIILHVTVGGLVDIANELVKYERKAYDLQKSIATMTATMNGPHYAKLKEAVREKNATQHAANVAELESITKVITSFNQIVNRKSYIPLKIADLQKDLDKCTNYYNKTMAPYLPVEGQEPKPISAKTQATLDSSKAEMDYYEGEIAKLKEELATL